MFNYIFRKILFLVAFFAFTNLVYSPPKKGRKKGRDRDNVSVIADTLTPFLTTLQKHLIDGADLDMIADNEIQQLVLDNINPLIPLLNNFYKEQDESSGIEKKFFAQRAFYYGFMIGVESFFISDVVRRHAQELYRIVYPVFFESRYSKCRALLPFIKGILEGIAYDKVIRPKGFFLALTEEREFQDVFCDGCEALSLAKEHFDVSSTLVSISLEKEGVYSCKLNLVRVAYLAGASLTDDVSDEAIAARDALISSTLFSTTHKPLSRRSDGSVSSSFEEKKGESDCRGGSGFSSLGSDATARPFLAELEQVLNNREVLPLSFDDPLENEILSCMRFLVGIMNRIDLLSRSGGRFFSDYALLRGFSLGAESVENLEIPSEQELMVRMFTQRLYAAVEKKFFLSRSLEGVSFFCFARGILDGIAYKRVAIKLGKNIKIKASNAQNYFIQGSSDYRRFIFKEFGLDRLRFALQVDAALLISVSETDLKLDFDSIAYLAGLNSLHDINDKAVQFLIDDVALRVRTAVQRKALSGAEASVLAIPQITERTGELTADGIEKVLPFITEYKNAPGKDLSRLSDFQQGFYCGVFNYLHVNSLFLQATAISLYESLMVNKDLSVKYLSLVDGIIEGFAYKASGGAIERLNDGVRKDASLYEFGLLLTFEQAYPFYQNFFEQESRALNLDDLEYLCGHLTSQSFFKLAMLPAEEVFARIPTRDHVESLLPEDKAYAGAASCSGSGESLLCASSNVISSAGSIKKRSARFRMEFNFYDEEAQKYDLLEFTCRREHYEKGLFEACQVFKENYASVVSGETLAGAFIQLKKRICGNNIARLVSQLKKSKTSELLDELSYEIGYAQGISRMREIDLLKQSCPAVRI